MTIIEALRNGEQCDEDGVMCIVSRQACHEGADMIETQQATISKIQTAISDWAAARLHAKTFKDGSGNKFHEAEMRLIAITGKETES
jgi:hypothetical protein